MVVYGSISILIDMEMNMTLEGMNQMIDDDIARRAA